MKQLLSRLHYIMTGVLGTDLDPDSSRNAWTAGSGTLAGTHVFIGWDVAGNPRIMPEECFPCIVIEPVSANETQRANPQRITSYVVQISIGVLVPSRLGALFGRRGTAGILDIEEALRALLKANRSMKDSTGATWTRDLISINSTSSLELTKGLTIKKRFQVLQCNWDRITF